MGTVPSFIRTCLKAKFTTVYSFYLCPGVYWYQINDRLEINASFLIGYLTVAYE